MQLNDTIVIQLINKNDQEKLACPSQSPSDQTVKTSLSELISVRPNWKNWLVRVNPCQFKLQKVACPNKVLSDYLMKFRSWEWSFASLFCEKQIMKREVLSI